MDGFTTRGKFRTRILASFIFSLNCLYAHNASAQNNFIWNLPSWAPTPIVPADNLMSVAKVDLGRRLFYEKNLSINKTTSCGTCHQQGKAFTDGKRVAIGATRDKHSKNTPTLTNEAYFFISFSFYRYFIFIYIEQSGYILFYFFYIFVDFWFFTNKINIYICNIEFFIFKFLITKSHK